MQKYLSEDHKFVFIYEIKFIVQMQVCDLCYRYRFINLITIKLEKDRSDNDYNDDDDGDFNDDKNNRIMMMMIRITKL